MTWHEIVGNAHMHTVYSDGGGTYDDIVAAARDAGLDFVIVTDHDVLNLNEEGWRDGVLVLVGVEVNEDGKRSTNHLLCMNVREPIADAGESSQAAIDAVRRQGGFGFIAHPFERRARLVDEPALNWHAWDVDGYAGMAIWNYMSEFKAHLSSLPAAALAVLWPNLVISGPFPETLAKYDELLAAGRRLAILGESDSHASHYAAGPLSKTIFPYAHTFRTINMHLLLPAPFSGDFERDAGMVYQALQAGRGFAGYHVAGDPAGFAFTARDEAGAAATFGEELHARGEVTLEVRSPAPARLRLIHHGEVVAESRGRSLAHRTREPGAYRVEAYRRVWLRERGWVFTNPIYVRGSET